MHIFPNSSSNHQMPSSHLVKKPLLPQGGAAKINNLVRKITKRRRKPPMQATPQTLAKLQPAPWANWPLPLQMAAQHINAAFRLIAANGLVHARDWEMPMSSGLLMTTQNLSPAAERLLRRYRRWAGQIERTDFNLIIDVVVHGEQPATAKDVDRLRKGLELWGA